MAHILQVEKPTDTMLFSAYGVSIQHPQTWSIYINPTKSFAFHDGLVKIDKNSSSKKDSSISLTLRWARPESPVSIDEYIEELQSQYTKKQQKNKRDYYEILSVEPVLLDHSSYLVHSTFIANHALYRSWGKEEQVDCLQLCTFCDLTGRLIVATIHASPEEMSSNLSYYKEILYTLKCH